MKNKHFKIGAFSKYILGLLCVMLASGCSNVNYLSRGQLQHKLYIDSQSQKAKDKNYGALQFKSNVKASPEASEEDDESPGRLFILQKRKGVYIGETIFHENKDKKYFFSLGLDYKHKAPTFGFRLEF
ncbi:hypothetical protein N9W34_03350 [Rickettsiales bacterium]|nr:hypothetical protein [Rickettsiales bacterium]